MLGVEKALETRFGYFPGCKYCRAVCVYRPEVSRLLEATDIDDVRRIILDLSRPLAQRYEIAAKTLKMAAFDWLGDENIELDAISFCAGLHIGTS